MSLYALFPGTSPAIVGGNTYHSSRSFNQPLRSANDFAKDLAKNCHDSQTLRRSSAKELKVVVDFSKIELEEENTSTPCSCHNSFSSTADETLSSSSLSLGLSYSDAEDSTVTSLRDEQNIKIQVHDLKINFLKLTRPSSQKETVKSVSRSKKDARLRRRRKHPQESAALTSFENAIEFDLALQFAGRKYTAKRTFNQMAQLHRDLLQEVSFWEQHQKVWNDWDDFPPLIRMGDFGGGFGQMSSLLQSFRPSLESWFKTLVSAVSEDNPILSDFLWEPLSTDGSLLKSRTIPEEEGPKECL